MNLEDKFGIICADGFSDDVQCA